MKTIKRTLAFATLCFILTGCTTYRAVEWDVPDPQEEPDTGFTLKTGQQVRVTLAGGDRYSGRVMSWDDEVLTIDSSRRRGIIKERTFGWSDIEVLETPHANPAGTVVLGVVAVGAVSLAVVGSQLESGFGN